MTATVQTSTSVVREFIHTIVAQAKAALNGIDRPGFLQFRSHIWSSTDRRDRPASLRLTI